jgi:hypothetical protein
LPVASIQPWRDVEVGPGAELAHLEVDAVAQVRGLEAGQGEFVVRLGARAVDPYAQLRALPGDAGPVLVDELAGRERDLAGVAAVEADPGTGAERPGVAEHLPGLGLALDVEPQFALDGGRGQAAAGQRAVADGVAKAQAQRLGRGWRGVLAVVVFRGFGPRGIGRAAQFQRHGADRAEETALVAALDHAHQRGLLRQLREGVVIDGFHLVAGPPGAAGIGQRDRGGQDSQDGLLAQVRLSCRGIRGHEAPGAGPPPARRDATGAPWGSNASPAHSSSLYNRAPVENARSPRKGAAGVDDRRAPHVCGGLSGV